MNQKVVLMTHAGDYYIDAPQARAIAEKINTAKFINTGDSMIAVSTIKAMLSEADYRAHARTNNKSWKCKHGAVHGAKENCQCARFNNPPALPAPADEMRPIEQTEIRRAFIHYALKNKRHEILKDPEAFKRFADNYENETDGDNDD